MYYRVIKNGKVIDVLERIIYVKYQEKHDQILICDIKEAEAVLSSDGKYAWHIDGLYHFKPDNSVGKLGNFNIMGNHNNGLVKHTACVL